MSVGGVCRSSSGGIVATPLMKEHLLYHVCQIFLFSFSLSHRLLSSSRVHHHHHHHHHDANDRLRALSIYRSIYLPILSILKRFVLAQILLSNLVPEDHRS